MSQPNDTWDQLLQMNVTGRTFHMDEPAGSNSGKMGSIVRDETDGYILFLDSNNQHIAGCAPAWGSAEVHTDGSIEVTLPMIGHLSIETS